MKATCGAVSGAIMVAGMMAQQKGYNKAETYKVCSQIPKMFEAKNPISPNLNTTNNIISPNNITNVLITAATPKSLTLSIPFAN